MNIQEVRDIQEHNLDDIIIEMGEKKEVGELIKTNKNTKTFLCCFQKYSYMEELEEFIYADKDIDIKQKNILLKNFISTGRNVEYIKNTYGFLNYTLSSLILIGSTLATGLLSIDSVTYFWPVWTLSLLVTVSKGSLTLFSVEKKCIDADSKLIILKEHIWKYILKREYDDESFIKFCSTLHSRLDNVIGNS